MANPYASHFYQVSRPSLPYLAPIPHGLAPGKQICITGQVPSNSTTFTICLLGNNDNNVFHQSIRFNENCVVRNTKLNGSYGKEERHGNMPFFRGQPFELLIAVEQSGYRVYVNGASVYEYNHRMPFHEVARLRIQGDVNIDRIVFSGAGGRSSRNNEIFNPPIPFVTQIVDGPQPGRLIQILGRTPPNANVFYFNLQSGPDSKQANLLFHCSVRFHDASLGGQQAVVRNSRRFGSWGREERAESHFPFSAGQPFEILVLLEQGEWKVAVNGQHFTSFPHRDNYHDASHFYIHGDVEVSAIRQF